MWVLFLPDISWKEGTMWSPLSTVSLRLLPVRQETLQLSPPPASIPTTSFDHLDALRVGLVEHLHVVDLPDKVPGPQTAGLRYRFLADVMITVEVTLGIRKNIMSDV